MGLSHLLDDEASILSTAPERHGAAATALRGNVRAHARARASADMKRFWQATQRQGNDACSASTDQSCRRLTPHLARKKYHFHAVVPNAAAANGCLTGRSRLPENRRDEREGDIHEPRFAGRRGGRGAAACGLRRPNGAARGFWPARSEG